MPHRGNGRVCRLYKFDFLVIAKPQSETIRSQNWGKGGCRGTCVQNKTYHTQAEETAAVEVVHRTSSILVCWEAGKQASLQKEASQALGSRGHLWGETG